MLCTTNSTTSRKVTYLGQAGNKNRQYLTTIHLATPKHVNQCIQIANHIISRSDAMGVQKGPFGHPKDKFSLKVAKFAGQIGIYLTLIFCMNDFVCATLSF